MKSRYMTIQTILRAAYAAVYVIEWLSGFSELWSKGVICERSPTRHRQQPCRALIVSSNQRVVIWILTAKIAPRSVRIAVSAWGRSVIICMVASRVGGSATSLCQSVGRYPLPMGSLFRDGAMSDLGCAIRSNAEGSGIETVDFDSLSRSAGLTQPVRGNRNATVSQGSTPPSGTLAGYSLCAARQPRCAKELASRCFNNLYRDRHPVEGV